MRVLALNFCFKFLSKFTSLPNLNNRSLVKFKNYTRLQKNEVFLNFINKKDKKIATFLRTLNNKFCCEFMQNINSATKVLHKVRYFKAYNILQR